MLYPHHWDSRHRRFVDVSTMVSAVTRSFVDWTACLTAHILPPPGYIRYLGYAWYHHLVSSLFQLVHIAKRLDDSRYPSGSLPIKMVSLNGVNRFTQRSCIVLTNTYSVLVAEEGIEPSPLGNEPSNLPLIYSAMLTPGHDRRQSPAKLSCL